MGALGKAAAEQLNPSSIAECAPCCQHRMGHPGQGPAARSKHRSLLSPPQLAQQGFIPRYSPARCKLGAPWQGQELGPHWVPLPCPNIVWVGSPSAPTPLGAASPEPPCTGCAIASARCWLGKGRREAWRDAPWSCHEYRWRWTSPEHVVPPSVPKPEGESWGRGGSKARQSSWQNRR